MPGARHPARRRPGRLRLLPPRSRSTGRPAARRRGAARPGPAPARPRPQGHPRGRRHQQRQPLLPQDTRARCWNSGRSPAPPPGSRPRPTTRKTAELARYKLGRLTADDADGYHRVQCPAAMGKIRCPLRPASMTLDRDRPEILQPPEHPQACCAQQTITVPPDVLRQDRAEARLPVRGLAPLLRPPHRRRARLRHRQGPRQQRHQPAAGAASWAWPPHAVHHHAARRPQPAHPRRLERPAGRKPAAAPPRACPRKPAGAAARPSPPSPPGRPNPAAAPEHPPHHQRTSTPQPGGSMPASHTGTPDTATAGTTAPDTATRTRPRDRRPECQTQT